VRQSSRSDKKHLIRDFVKTSLGWELALPIFGGAFLGYQIDRFTSSSVPYTLIFILLGIAVGYYNLIRHIELEMLHLKVQKKHDQEKPSQ
jgi:F0F1-type ATP synthase assembly protein I